jgi:diaminopimelate epimerase
MIYFSTGLIVSLAAVSSAFVVTPTHMQTSRRTVFGSTKVLSATVAADASSTSTKSSSADSISFSKYHGLGNDFILIDNRHESDPILTPEQAQKMCDRNFGIGGDGVIFLLPAPSAEYDYAMRIYNRDGSEPEMCGNGIRCLAQFIVDLEKTDKIEFVIDTLAGPIVPRIEGNVITVDMGEPILDGPSVPTTLPVGDDGTVVQVPYGKWKITAVSMGNPHAVIFVDDLDRDVDLMVDGPLLEGDTSIFPAKANIEFVQVMNESHLRMKVFERGAGPTLACGTGACALVVAAMRAGQIPRLLAGGQRNRVRVTLPGGDLFIDWAADNKVYMTGSATLAFLGTARL